MIAQLSDSLRARIADEYAKGCSIELVGRLLNLSYNQVRDTLHALERPIHGRGGGTRRIKAEWASYGGRWESRLPSRKEDELAALYGSQQYADDPQACGGEPRFRGMPTSGRATAL
jgi:hypothetical protein